MITFGRSQYILNQALPITNFDNNPSMKNSHTISSSSEDGFYRNNLQSIPKFGTGPRPRHNANTAQKRAPLPLRPAPQYGTTSSSRHTAYDGSDDDNASVTTSTTRNSSSTHSTRSSSTIVADPRTGSGDEDYHGSLYAEEQAEKRERKAYKEWQAYHDQRNHPIIVRDTYYEARGSKPEMQFFYKTPPPAQTESNMSRLETPSTRSDSSISTTHGRRAPVRTESSRSDYSGAGYRELTPAPTVSSNGSRSSRDQGSWHNNQHGFLLADLKVREATKADEAEVDRFLAKYGNGDYDIRKSGGDNNGINEYVAIPKGSTKVRARLKTTSEI
jgi:hypothetical protein